MRMTIEESRSVLRSLQQKINIPIQQDSTYQPRILLLIAEQLVALREEIEINSPEC